MTGKFIGKIVLIFSIVVVLSTSTLAQDSPKRFYFGPELQVYPTGIIPGLRLEYLLTKSSFISVRAAVQIIDHRDLGVHDDETGTGYGYSIGYHRKFGREERPWSMGVRCDIWHNSIDWMDDTPLRFGNSQINVFQPTVILGYDILPSTNNVIRPSIGFGYEWNAITNGEPTGEGPILLVGIYFGF
ncbi:MAG: hypothetical protein AAFQ02_06600 [Bacteroidota bacterium]